MTWKGFWPPLTSRHRRAFKILSDTPRMRGYRVPGPRRLRALDITEELRSEWQWNAFPAGAVRMASASARPADEPNSDKGSLGRGLDRCLRQRTISATMRPSTLSPFHRREPDGTPASDADCPFHLQLFQVNCQAGFLKVCLKNAVQWNRAFKRTLVHARPCAGPFHRS